ncbi:MAG: D-lyxose/D-mannose family sugar isomerase [Bacteroidota bacterium]
MLTRAQYTAAQRRAAQMIRASGLAMTDAEAERIEVADFGLNHLETEGAQILTLVQTERISVKVLAMFPDQTEPEHWHPPVGDDPGKEETVRVISGTLLFYIPGDGTEPPPSTIPAGKGHAYTCYRELVMQPTDQITLAPGTKHWFKGGPEGAVFYSFSTIARDVLDGFTDPDVQRVTQIVD